MEPKDYIALGSLLISIISFEFSRRNNNRQKASDIAKKASEDARLAYQKQNDDEKKASEDARLAYQKQNDAEKQEFQKKIEDERNSFAQRQIVIPLWAQLKEISHIDPTPGKVVWVDVIKSLNILELLAICWNKRIVDKEIMATIFGEDLDTIYKTLKSINEPMRDYPIKKPVSTILAENKNINLFYASISKYKTKIEEQELIDNETKKGII